MAIPIGKLVPLFILEAKEDWFEWVRASGTPPCSKDEIEDDPLTCSLLGVDDWYPDPEDDELIPNFFPKPLIFSAAFFAKPFDMLIAVCLNDTGAVEEW